MNMRFLAGLMIVVLAAGAFLFYQFAPFATTAQAATPPDVRSSVPEKRCPDGSFVANESYPCPSPQPSSPQPSNVESCVPELHCAASPSPEGRDPAQSGSETGAPPTGLPMIAPQTGHPAP